MKMDLDETEYAIVVDKTQAMLMMSSNLQYDRNFEDGKLEVFRGTTVQIKGRQNNYSVVVICDFHQMNLAFQNNLYYIKNSVLHTVDESIWLQLVAIPDPHERANITKDKAYIEFLSALKVGSFVSVTSQLFSNCPIRQSLQFLPERDTKDQRDQDFDCIVRYIGFVNEIGAGYYYGLELLVIFHLFSQHQKKQH
jgi:hypothetical protein